MIAFVAWLRLGPIPHIETPRHVTIVDRHGEVLYESLGASGNRTEWLSADALPPRIVDATLAAEDRRFFSHIGIDPIAVSRAAAHNVRAMRVVEGGSTITQQVAKLILQSRDRSLRSKWRESVVALRLEHRYTKREILAMYLNLAPYGNRITGAARASRAYFGCAPENLTPAQAAFLASLPQRPGAFNPRRDAQRARARQLHVLARMQLTPQELALARAERLRFVRGAQPVLAMHFVERVLGGRTSSSAPRGADETSALLTTLDADLQRDVIGIIDAHRKELLRHGASSVAVAVLDNASGEWLAWEGSGDYFGEGFGGAIDGVTTPRQPGSALKPFTYALAFESGETPATVLADVPSHFPTAEEGIVYSPRNYDGRYRGPLRIRAALAGSQNVPAVAMLSKLGPEALLRLLRNAGFTDLQRTADYYGLGLTLGDAEVTLEQLVKAYSLFAGQPGNRATGQPFAKRTAFWITDILADPEARAYAFGTGGSLDFPFPVAVKTGTSQSYRDNWTIGYTKDVTVGVWVGNFDLRPLRGSTGVTGAAPVFHAVMLAAMKRARGTLPIGDSTPIVAPTADVESVEICALSGARPTQWCDSLRKEWLPVDAAPRFCSWHHDHWIDWPAEYRGWLPPQRAQTATMHRAPLEIANPPDGATYLIDPTLRSEFQTLRLRALAATRVAWHIDDRRIGSSSPGGSLEWPLAPGMHVITAIDAQGRRDSSRIWVK
ncbi:MAG TPA: penicillin-binding protein 1C [Thermoanaerobaculia bacterium]|nr:penicillin-binding protein 1C [Thermoanaerobaculia bacterium]